MIPSFDNIANAVGICFNFTCEFGSRPPLMPIAAYRARYRAAPEEVAAQGSVIVRTRQAGFTLIEVALVLVIVGLLLGGVLKGQELTTAARVRNVISMQYGFKAAYFGFLDRYRALPGDYRGAANNIPGCGACLDGNSDGQIAGPDEPQMAWEHLSKAGFITGSYTYPLPGAGPSPVNTPTNPYGAPVQLIYDGIYQDGAAATGPERHNIKTGASIPSNTLAEVDRKIDDGSGTGGEFRYSAFSGVDNSGGACFNTSTGNWQSATPIASCGATSLF